MKKIILTIFLSFFISSTSSSNSENIKIAIPLKDNLRLVNECKDDVDKKVIILNRLYNNLNNPIVFEKYGDDLNAGWRGISNLFLDNQKKEFIFYDNLGGILVKYVFSGNFEKPDLKSYSFFGGRKAETLFNDMMRIVEISKKNSISSNEYIKRLKEYSISVKDHYEETIKKDNKYRNIREKNFICKETVVFNIIN
jgi:hypothetical protein